MTVIEMLPQVLANTVPLRKAKLLGRLRQKGVVIMAGTTCEEVSPEGLNVCSKDGQKQIVPADTVVVATGSKPDKTLYDALQGKMAGLYLVGDAAAPRSIFEAVEEGFNAGLTV